MKPLCLFVKRQIFLLILIDSFPISTNNRQIIQDPQFRVPDIIVNAEVNKAFKHTCYEQNP
jgi:hypothetical protein